MVSSGTLRDLARLVFGGLAGLLLFVLVTVCGLGVILGSSLVVGLLVAPLVLLLLRVVRRFADAHRRWAGRVLDRSMPVVGPAPAKATHWVVRLTAPALDRRSWRDLWWLGLHGPVALILGLAPFGLVGAGVLGLAAPWLYGGRGAWTAVPFGVAALAASVPLLSRSPRLVARLAERLLAPDPAVALRERVAQLHESRAAVIDAQAAEIRRIERDLHDGPQARLASLAMNLGLVEQILVSDPDGARALIGESRRSAREALEELRDLVHGILPPVLAERGLAGAIEALSLDSPIPVRLDLDLPRRPDRPLETALYFTMAELLANAVKHSGADSIAIGLRLDRGTLRLWVADDGAGGADPARGRGLAGVRRRLNAFDASLTIDSPPGGPTRIEITAEPGNGDGEAEGEEISCASSSPRTTHSYETV